MINLLIPSSWASANEGSGDLLMTDGKSVTESVYDADADRDKANFIAAPVNAGSITENIITSVVMKDKDKNPIETVRPDQGSRVQIDFGWKLPADHGYSAGAIFTFNLPDKFKVDRILTGDLDGGFGTYEVTPEGKVNFIFNEEIEEQEELTGYFFVWREFEEREFSGGTQQEVTFQFQGDSVKIPVHFKSKSNSEIDKQGIANKGMNPGEINWVVDFNKGEKPIEKAIFKDVLPNGLAVDMDSIEVYELEVQLDGSVRLGSPYTGYTVQQNGDGFELQLGDIKSAYQVKYTTDITGTTDTTYVNKAAVSGSNQSDLMEKSASVPVKYSKPLDKKSTGYIPAAQTVTWAIQYNYNEQFISKADAWIKDMFNVNHQALVSGSFEVYEMTINDNGSAHRTTGTPLVFDTDYKITPNSEGFSLSFQKDIRAAYEISYKTTAKDRVHEDSYTVKNFVEIADGSTKGASRDINQVIFSKSAGAVNYAAKTITWKLSLNDDEKEMQNVVIRDSFAGQGLTLLPETLSISGLSLADGDYTLEPDLTYDDGFKITFHKPTTTSLDITYSTYFDSTRVNNEPYKNKAVLNWDENGIAQPSITKSASVSTDNYTKDNGHKTGKYNAQTKEITWTIDINYNLHKINEAVVRDFYTGEQTFLPNSLSVHHLTLTGDSNGVRIGAQVPAEDYTFEKKRENETDGFELRLGPIDTAYRITYKTSLKEHPVAAEYSNKATLHDAQKPGSLIFEKSAEVKPKFGGEYVNKTGSQGAGAEQDFAFWQVNINRSLSYIEAGAVLTDTLSSNQILVKDSFKLYSTIADPSGNLRRGGLVDQTEYILDVQGNSFTLTLKKEIETSFILEYQSFINADDGESINNNVTLEGQSSGVVEENKNEHVTVKFSGAGGGANSPGKGNLKVIKVDADTKKPLEGARFGLYDKSGSNLLKELVTDEQGEAVFEDYKYKDYMLKELAAPSGYLIAAEYKSGSILQFKADMTHFTVENVKGNWDVELTKVDQDEQTKTLEGAVFKLQYSDGGVYSDVPGHSEITSDLYGKIQLSNLKPGSYRFIEIKAPKGYKLNENPIPFTIDPNQTSPKRLMVQNEIYIGSVELLKVDADTGSILPDAEFDLWDAEGRVLKNGLITDQDGKVLVDQLKAGSYQFVEIKAPDEYVLNVEPMKFEIIDGNKVNVVFKNKLNTGSVKLTKIEKGRPAIKLPGAEFRILDANMDPVKNRDDKEIAGLTTDLNGELLIPNLRLGKYFIEETRAPYGYVVKDKWIEIEIISGEETEVMVENTRSPGSGGGGGGNPPSPPVDPNPEKPVDPTPETPVGPEEPGQPGETVDPVEPTDPTVPSDPTTPTDGIDPNPPVEQETEPSGKDNSGKTPVESTKPQKPSGNVLPKTGEESPLPMQLAGFGLITLGALLFMFRRKFTFHQ